MQTRRGAARFRARHKHCGGKGTAPAANRETNMFGDEAVIELAKLQREALERVVAKRAAEQLGEAWIGLDDRRHSTAMRGPDRRAA